MPTYTFTCKKCNIDFEVHMNICDYSPKQPCEKCHSPDDVDRNLEVDWASTTPSVKLGDHELKLGHLAKRNSERLSADEKESINRKNNDYKQSGYEAASERLGGATFYGPKGQRKPSKIQKSKDPKRKTKE